nr:argininosuccinate synthase domain-containing protein [Kushneria aurantia]
MKIVLAYSGGLDTSIALAWLQKQYNAEVIAFCANIGQGEDLSSVEERAKANGAAAVYIEDLRDKFIRQFAFRSMRAGALYEGRYHMAASLGRPLIAKRLVEIARLEGADAVAHGRPERAMTRFASTRASLRSTLACALSHPSWSGI